MQSEPILTARGLNKSYPEGGRQRQILRDLDLEIGRGESVALLGRSGSGKSTLLNLLGGIDRADAGEICVDGSTFSRLDETQRSLLRRRHIGFIYQAFNLIPTLSAWENVALPLELNGIPYREAQQQATRLLDEMGLRERCHAAPDRLSGGEQQRVAIARALVHGPSLVLADEPTGNLDAETGGLVLDLLTRIFANRGHGLLVVTHSLSVAQRMDRVVSLVDGKIQAAIPSESW